VLNHQYPFYSGGNYEPYATLLYKRDDYLYPTSWMDMNRDYHHILTNNNGDSLAELSEKLLAFNTTNYPDGDYRIIVEAYDAYNNGAIDSMDVRFRNNISSLSTSSQMPLLFALHQNFPNPFNPVTIINYQLPMTSDVQLKVHDLLGREIITLIDERKPAGQHEVEWNAGNLPSGLYFYSLQAGNYHDVKKMILMK
jgi:hypothetical protein